MTISSCQIFLQSFLSCETVFSLSSFHYLHFLWQLIEVLNFSVQALPHADVIIPETKVKNDISSQLKSFLQRAQKTSNQLASRFGSPDKTEEVVLD